MKRPMTPIDYYLSWVNDFLSIEKFAAYYGFETLIEAQDMIARGRLMHEAAVAEFKARGES